MHEKASVYRVLTRHFFGRFFDNDTVQTDGDTLTTVTRALSFVAVPGLMVAFFLQNQYPKRSLWGSIEDQYFFVLFSFVVTGAVAVFEWEMLFPDRLDFLVLTPFPLRPAQMLGSKALALGGFLGLFLFATNVFGSLMLPIVSQGRFLRHVFAHTAAVLLSGSFAALSLLALGGVLLCVLTPRQVRTVSPIVQALTIAALVLLMLSYGKPLQAALAEPLGRARWVPSFWFLGLYEYLLRGAQAPPFAAEMARYAIRGTLLAAGVAALTYPLAWAKMRRMAIEGAPRAQRRPSQRLQALLHKLVQRPGERAVFHFAGQTLARNNHYQVYLAMYCGAGLALAIACAVTFQVHGGHLQLALSDKGLHAVMPLLLFWVVAGLRTAFASPLNLAAGWVFRVTGVDLRECASAARRWVFLCAVSVMACVMVALRFAGWDTRQLLVQLGCGLCLAVLLMDGFFFAPAHVPFNRPRMPGRTSLPLMLTLYIGVLPQFLFGMISLERTMEKRPMKLLFAVLLIAAMHLGLSRWRRSSTVEEPREEYDGEFQLLGLSFQ